MCGAVMCVQLDLLDFLFGYSVLGCKSLLSFRSRCVLSAK